jgi:hypothetical protein
MGEKRGVVAALQPSFGLTSFYSRHERDRTPLSLLREELSSFRQSPKEATHVQNVAFAPPSDMWHGSRQVHEERCASP